MATNGNNKFLFEFQAPKCKDIQGSNDGAVETIKTEIAEGLQTGAVSRSMANVPVPPDGASNSDINITKQFRWTKSSKDSITVQNTPTISLREYVVAVPAFFQNLALLTDQIYGPGNPETPGGVQGTFNALTNNEEVFGEHHEGIRSIPYHLRKGINNVFKFGQDLSKHVEGTAAMAYNTTKFNMPWYLKSYENIYGVKKTNFMYRVPYLEDNVKSISNNWAGEGSILSPAIKLLAGVTSAISPGVGIDFAKSFKYPETGPSYNISFYLDNTRIDDVSEWQKNYRLIYLLIYQNLPNRVNRSAITPPVIYQSSLPGVFSYRWSFLSKLNVNFIGVRRKMKIKVTPKTPVTEAIIPEGYEVQMTLNSLTPETKNLMFDSINNPVRAWEETKPFEGDLSGDEGDDGQMYEAAQTGAVGARPGGMNTGPGGFPTGRGGNDGD